MLERWADFWWRGKQVSWSAQPPVPETPQTGWLWQEAFISPSSESGQSKIQCATWAAFWGTDPVFPPHPPLREVGRGLSEASIRAWIYSQDSSSWPITCQRPHLQVVSHRDEPSTNEFQGYINIQFVTPRSYTKCREVREGASCWALKDEQDFPRDRRRESASKMTSLIVAAERKCVGVIMSWDLEPGKLGFNKLDKWLHFSGPPSPCLWNSDHSSTIFVERWQVPTVFGTP